MDVVDEQLDTIGKAFLAQTIGCARCHDHKFDPIPTRDYYALAGILRNTRTLEHANVSKWLEKPLPASPDQEAAIQEHDERVASLEARIKAERGRMLAEGKTLALGRGAIGAGDLPGIVVDDTQARKVGDWKESQVGAHLHRRRLRPRRQLGQGREDPHLPARFPRGRQIRGLARLHQRLESSDGGPGDDPQRRRREDGDGRHESGPADRRPVHLPRPVSLREERPGLCDGLQRGDDGMRRRRCRGLHPRSTRPRRITARLTPGRSRRSSARWKPS